MVCSLKMVLQRPIDLNDHARKSFAWDRGLGIGDWGSRTRIGR